MRHYTTPTRRVESRKIRKSAVQKGIHLHNGFWYPSGSIAQEALGPPVHCGGVAKVEDSSRERPVEPGAADADAGFKTRLIPHQARTPVAPDVPAGDSGSAPPGADPLADYAIRGKIGSGGMGVVFLAVDRRLGRFVAIKRLKLEFRDEPSIRRRFLREGRTAAALNNVHIAHIYSIGEDADGPFIVMEYVESGLPKTEAGAPAPPQTFEQYVAQNGPFKLEESLAFMLKLGHAIEAAHGAGVIHRDLKSANILMDASGEPKIVDFGLARFTRPDAVTSLTVAGDKFVSLGYGAPEQESDATLSDERADVYGLGALLYFALTGKNPRFFREEDLPASVRPVVCKALATDRDARYQSVVGFDAALLALLAESKTEKPTVRTTWRCKWCDTVNPLATRFCGECGWDGREQCRECAADQQFGTQFCGVCGANAREYESVSALLRKIRLAIDSRQYEWAYNYASQPMTFEPVGPGGRHILDEIQSLGASARKRFQRREQLRGIIASEMAAENFERAQRFIQEYRDLSTAADAYAGELAAIPGLMHKRDLLRVAKAFAMKDWELGERLLETMSPVDEAMRDERDRLGRQCAHHRRNVFALRAGAAATAAFAAYLLLLPMAVRLEVPGARFVWKPAFLAAETGAVGRAMARYASWWGVADLGAFFANPPPQLAAAAPSASALSPLDALRKDYDLQMLAVQRELAEIERGWGDEYARALEDLREQNRAAGYYENWKLVDDEMVRFAAERTIAENGRPAPVVLAALRDSFRALRDQRRTEVFRRQVAVTRAYIADLDRQVRELTKDGKMQEADRFNEVLKAFRNDAAYLEAERWLADSDARNPEGTLPEYILPGADSAAIQELKGRYEAQRRKADEDLAGAIAKWGSDYAQALATLRDQRQRDGDFLGLQAAAAEIGRFELDRVIPDAAPGAESQPLEQFRERFRKTRAAIEDNHATAIAAAAEAYDQALADQASRQTKEGKIDAAAATMAERRRVERLPEVLTARERLTARKQKSR